jgi:hypothetical protein
MLLAVVRVVTQVQVAQEVHLHLMVEMALEEVVAVAQELVAPVVAVVVA